MSASRTTSAHRSRRAEVALLGLCKRNRIELSPNLATNSKSFCFLPLVRFMLLSQLEHMFSRVIVSEPGAKSSGISLVITQP